MNKKLAVLLAFLSLTLMGQGHVTSPFKGGPIYGPVGSSGPNPQGRHYFIVMSSDQDPVAAGDPILFDTLAAGTDSDITVSPAGAITFVEGGVFDLTAVLGAIVNSGGCASFGWELDSVPTGRVAIGGLQGGGNNQDVTFQPIARMIVTVPNGGVARVVGQACGAAFTDVAIAERASHVEIVEF